MSSLLLAIDTCEANCSATIIDGDSVCARRVERIGRGHAERLLPMLGELFAEANAVYKDLGKIAVCTGPGTFTGLRIGLSVARGLALANRIDCVGLTSLPVLAAQATQSDDEVVHVVVMGRGGQGFYQAFKGKDADGLPMPLLKAQCMDGSVIQDHILSRPGVVVGSGAPLAGVDTPIDALDPVMLARLCQKLNPDQFLPEPVYLREADAKKGKALLPVER